MNVRTIRTYFLTTLGYMRLPGLNTILIQWIGDSSQGIIMWLRQLLSCCTAQCQLPAERDKQLSLPPAFVLGSNRFNTSWSYVCTGHTDEIDIDFLFDKVLQQTSTFPLNAAGVTFQAFMFNSGYFLLLLKWPRWGSLSYLVMWISTLCCGALETAEPCHLHCTPLSDMTNSARGQKTLNV